MNAFMKTKEELFERLWKILYSGKEDREKEIDPDIRNVIESLYDLTVIPEPDYDKMWDRIIKGKIPRRKYLVRRILKYAIVIVLPLLLILGGLFMTRQEGKIVSDMKLFGRPENAIVLTLSDGSKVDLREIRQKKLVHGEMVEIRQDSIGLIYTVKVKEDSIQRYNVLDVPVAADFRLQLSDGTVVYLNSGSRLKYPVSFKGTERKVFLEGEAYFEVVRNERQPFRVAAGEVEVEVLGTSFNMNAYPEREGVQTTLANGKIRVVNQEKSVILSPGEQASCVNGDIHVREVDVKEFTSWKNGLFIFNKMTLKDIMIQMERWYGLQVLFFDSEIEKYTFTGMIDKNLPAEETFKVIEKVVDVNFSLKDGNVIVTKLK